MVGQYVISKAGHDKGTIYLVVAEAGQRVLLADGKSKTLARPKVKNRKHIQPIQAFAKERVLQILREGGSLYPEEIRRLIREYRDGAAMESNN